MGPYRCLTAGSDHHGTFGVMRLRSTSLLPCPVARLVEELARPELLDKISAPMLVFEPVDQDAAG